MSHTSPGKSTRIDQSRRDQAVDASQLTRQLMLKAMHVLESALAKPAPHRESAWRTAVVKALDVLGKTMQRQSADLSGEEGLLADILNEAPRLENRVQQLRRQYDDLVRQIGSLRTEFSSSSVPDGSSDVSDVRQRLAWLLTALRHFQSRETDLIYEAIQVDIGVGD